LLFYSATLPGKAAFDITLDLDTVSNFEPGDRVKVVQGSKTQIHFIEEPGVTIYTASKKGALAKEGATAELVYLGNNAWSLEGQLS
jgi:hypothetical protein